MVLRPLKHPWVSPASDSSCQGSPMFTPGSSPLRVRQFHRRVGCQCGSLLMGSSSIWRCVTQSSRELGAVTDIFCRPRFFRRAVEPPGGDCTPQARFGGRRTGSRIIAAGLPPSDFLNATLPTLPPPPAPTPTPSPQAAHHQSWFWRQRIHRPCQRLPQGQKPPTIRIPSAHARSSAGRDPAQLPCTFPSEVARPKGAIVCTLFPPCKRCNNTGRLCTLEVGHPLAPKTP
jgi:hypothetical protein